MKTIITLIITAAVTLLTINNTAKAGTLISYPVAQNIFVDVAEKFASFKASAHDTKVFVSWSTGNETGTSHFEVERSFNGSDFATIAIVLDGIMMNDGNKTYKMKDNAAQSAGIATVYYRLKKVSTNGHFSYSSKVAVKF